jgi:hypothetical protein
LRGEGPSGCSGEQVADGDSISIGRPELAIEAVGVPLQSGVSVLTGRAQSLASVLQKEAVAAFCSQVGHFFAKVSISANIRLAFHIFEKKFFGVIAAALPRFILSRINVRRAEEVQLLSGGIAALRAKPPANVSHPFRML